MDDDFPAAHSMDTVWFAVDEAGHVGIFTTGEDGHVPVHTDQDDGLELMNALEGKADDPDEEWKDRATRLGLFYYGYGWGTSAIVDPYQREASPPQPIHMDQLPPALRKRARKRCLKKMDFAQQAWIQPLEQLECDLSNEDEAVAYLCGDGKTVRPIPGKEDRFAGFCEQVRKENPKAAKKFVFEGPQEKPKKPRRRRRKENDDGK